MHDIKITSARSSLGDTIFLLNTADIETARQKVTDILSMFGEEYRILDCFKPARDFIFREDSCIVTTTLPFFRMTKQMRL